MGGSNDKAQHEAQAAEAQRLADIKATQQRIESIFSDPKRERDIQSVVSATQQFLGRDLSEQNAEQARQLKFALARNGQTMGSFDVDAHKQLGRDYLKAALEVTRRAQQAGAGLRTADQQAKMNLFSQAQAGLDMATAARQAGESMRVNLANSKASATEDGLGDFFSNLGDVYKTSRETAGQRAAERYQYGTFYAPTGASGGAWGG